MSDRMLCSRHPRMMNVPVALSRQVPYSKNKTILLQKCISKAFTQKVKHTLTVNYRHSGVFTLKLLNFQPALFIVDQQLKVVLPFWFTVVLDFKNSFEWVGMGLVDTQYLSTVPHFRLVVLLVKMADPLTHQVWVVLPNCPPSLVNSGT